MSDATPLSSPPLAEVRPKTSASPGGRWVSLRTKGMVAFAALILYSVSVTLIVLHKKDEALGQVAELQRVFREEELLRRVSMAVFHTVVVVNDSIYSERSDRDVQSIEFDFRMLQAAHAEWVADVSEGAPNLDALNVSFEWLSRNPSREHALEFAQRLNQLVTALSERMRQVTAREAVLTHRYRVTSDSVVMTGLVLGLLGLVLFGAIVSLFFTRLTSDLKALRTRAVDIVRGYRGPPLGVTRHDEVGHLMEAVNRMGAELRQGELELAMERQKYYHQDKMAAIGALAAGVAHEIGNPIAAIAGVAQAMQDTQRQGQCASSSRDCHPEMILVQTARLAQITREIADFATVGPSEPQLQDLNTLVRTTTSLVRYDRRFQRIALKLDLDTQLPAVPCVGDHVTQVLMNLLINAADALEGIEGRAPGLRVSTRMQDRFAVLAVGDNGCGMDAATLERATEIFFTTKPPGSGTGLGLALACTIAAAHGGRIEIDSRAGEGTTVRMLLPVDAKDADPTDLRSGKSDI